jgi:hypothetical protein
MNCRGCGRKWSLLNFKILSRHFPDGNDENYEKHHSGTPGRDLKLEPPEYEAEMLNHSTTTVGLWVRFWRERNFVSESRFYISKVL